MGDTGKGTVGKAIGLLDMVSRFGKPVRFSELQQHSDLPKATLYRFLRILCDEGMLAKDKDSRTYRLGIRLVGLAHSAWHHFSLGDIARYHLDSLARQVGETIHLAQLENGQVLYIDKRNAIEPIEMFSGAGKVGPAFCTGIGKAMLAHLDEPRLSRSLEQQAYFAYTENTLTNPSELRRELEMIRSRGYAYDREEHEPGIVCIAYPIRSGTRMFGGVSITSSVQRHSLDSLNGYRAALEDAARKIGEEAATRQFPA